MPRPDICALHESAGVVVQQFYREVDDCYSVECEYCHVAQGLVCGQPAERPRENPRGQTGPPPGAGAPPRNRLSVRWIRNRQLQAQLLAMRPRYHPALGEFAHAASDNSPAKTQLPKP